MPPSENLDAYFQVFGVPLQVILPEEEIEILGLFDNAFQTVSQGDVDINSRAPILLLKDTDIMATGLRQGSLLRVNGVEYRAKSPEPDGTGLSDVGLLKNRRS